LGADIIAECGERKLEKSPRPIQPREEGRSSHRTAREVPETGYRREAVVGKETTDADG
jgi:hypothetical protein